MGAGRHIWVMSAIVYMCINVCVGLDLHVWVMCEYVCVIIKGWVPPSPASLCIEGVFLSRPKGGAGSPQ